LDRKKYSDLNQGIFERYPLNRESDYSIPALRSKYSDPSKNKRRDDINHYGTRNAPGTVPPAMNTNAQATTRKIPGIVNPATGNTATSVHDDDGTDMFVWKPTPTSGGLPIGTTATMSIYQNRMVYRASKLNPKDTWPELKDMRTQETVARFLYDFFDWAESKGPEVVKQYETLNKALTALTDFGKKYKLDDYWMTRKGFANDDLKTIFKKYADSQKCCLTVFQTISDVNGLGATTYYNTFESGSGDSPGKCNTINEKFFWMTVDTTGDTFSLASLVPVREKKNDWGVFWKKLFENREIEYSTTPDRDAEWKNFDSRHKDHYLNYVNAEKNIDTEWRDIYERTMNLGGTRITFKEYVEDQQKFAKAERKKEMNAYHKDTFASNNPGLAEFQELKIGHFLSRTAKSKDANLSAAAFSLGTYESIFRDGIYQDDGTTLFPLFKDILVGSTVGAAAPTSVATLAAPTSVATLAAPTSVATVGAPASTSVPITPKMSKDGKGVDGSYLFRSVVMCLQGEIEVNPGRSPHTMGCTTSSRKKARYQCSPRAGACTRLPFRST